MKLLILACLMAVALARPTFPLRHPELIQNESDSTEEVLKERKFTQPIPRGFRKECINRRELLREKQNDELKEHIMNDSEQKISSSSSSSEEVVPTNIEQKHIPREDVVNQRSLEQLIKYNQLQLEAVQDQKYIQTQKLLYYPYLEQLPRINEYSHIQLTEPIVNQEQVYFYLEPFQQHGAYLYVAWCYSPQIMQYIPSSPFYGIPQPTAAENDEKTDVVPVVNN